MDTTTVDGGGQVLRTNTLLLLCRGMCKRLPFVLIWLARPGFCICVDPNTVVYLLLYCCRNGTNDHEQPRSVPFRSVRFHKVEQG